MQKFSTTIALISALASLGSAGFAWQSNSIAKEANAKSEVAFQVANRISNESNTIASQANSIALQSESNRIVTSAYKSIYDGSSNEAIMRQIIDYQDIQLDTNLTKFIDIFEGVGADYCRGMAYREHIRDSLLKPLQYICSNNQIANQFGGQSKHRKNGTAMLCDKLLPGSNLATNVMRDYYNTCKFLELEKE